MEQKNENIEMPNEVLAVKKIADEFGVWPINEHQLKHIDDIKWKFDQLHDHISCVTPPQNGRYLSIVKTKLEEACMFAVKGISKP